jgi:hypothetical protein
VSVMAGNREPGSWRVVARVPLGPATHR